MEKKYIPFWMLAGSLFLLFIVYDLVQDGMFMDGMIYTCVGKNLANGYGSFWHPHFAQFRMAVYHEQPPLMFGLEAVFFKLLGNSMYVERFYALVMVLSAFFLIHSIWRLWFYKQPDLVKLSWFPVLLWMLVPVNNWSVINNVEENTMSVFVLASVYFIIQALMDDKRIYLKLCISGLFIVGASLCKGMQGMFPLVAIFFYWLVFRRISFITMLKYSFVLLVPVIVVYTIIALNQESLSSYQMYFHDRIMNTFNNGGMATTQNRFNLIYKLLNELIPAILVGILLIIIAVRKGVSDFKDKTQYQDSVFFTLIGLSGTLPLMVTFEQRRFYLVTAMPYFILAICILTAPVLFIIIDKFIKSGRGYLLFRRMMWVLLILSFLFSLYGIGKTKRDHEMLHDVYLIGSKMQEGDCIGVPRSLFSAWSLHAYFNRYFYISLDYKNVKHHYFIHSKDANQSDVPPDYQKVDIPTMKYNLYRIKTN